MLFILLYRGSASEKLKLVAFLMLQSILEIYTLYDLLCLATCLHNMEHHTVFLWHLSLFSPSLLTIR